MSDYQSEQIRLTEIAVLVADSSDEALALVISEITRRTEFLGRRNALDSVRDDLALTPIWPIVMLLSALSLLREMQGIAREDGV